MVLHIFFLHRSGRNNPLSLSSATYKVPFHYYFRAKDTFFFALVVFMLSLVSLTIGYSLIDAENFIPANPLVTPTHIQPEWYFLFAYAILRRIPDKLGGVVALLASVLMLFLFTISPTSFFFRGYQFSPVRRLVY